jgi:hypothetical protein
MTKYAIQNPGASGGATKKSTAPRTSTTKSISYSDTTNDLLLDISKDASASSQKSGDISMVRVSNTGSTPAVAIFGFQQWTDEDTIGNENFLHFLLSPGEVISMPATRAIMTDNDTDLYEGEPLNSQVVSSNLEVDSGATLAENVEDSDTEFNVSDSDYFRVGDCIQLGINDSTTTRQEVMEVTAIGTNNLTVRRALYGTSAADKDSQTDSTNGAVSGAKIYFPIFNKYHDYDKYSVVQTDNLGRYRSTNFFGYGRAATALSGITPGSVAIQFYTKGYQGLGLSDVTSNTPTGLTASTTYYLTIAADGGSALEINFTTDATNGNFGGENGLISKIQDALDTAYYTAGNLFEKKVNVVIRGGDVIFESQSKLSTSAIALTAGTSGSGASVRFLAQANGRIPALANIASAVDARLEPELNYDRVTYSSSYKNIFITDDGYGNLKYAGRSVGTINYETGAVDWQISSCPNAEFVISALYNAPFSGKQDSTDAAKVNSLMEVLGNTPQQKGGATLKVETF